MARPQLLGDILRDMGITPDNPLGRIIPDDGYADGGEPYTDEELAIIDED